MTCATMLKVVANVGACAFRCPECKELHAVAEDEIAGLFGLEGRDA